MAEDINRDPLAGTGALWEALLALLPRTKEELKLDLSEKVERSVVMLLQEATELFYGGRRSECLQTSEAVLDYSWEKLNTGPWQDVDKDWRRVYAFGCLLKAACLCEASEDATTVAAALKVCDMGLLMGAAILGDILIKVAAILQTHLLSRKRPAQGPTQEQPSTKKARNEHVSIPDMKSERTVPRLHCPSLQYFRKHFLVPERPVILEGVADHWPCMKKWSLEYIQEVAGCRTVPVEVGSRYTDEEWSQTLMTVNEFISKYIVDELQVLLVAGCGTPPQRSLMSGAMSAPRIRTLGRCSGARELNHSATEPAPSFHILNSKGSGWLPLPETRVAENVDCASPFL
ncbi:bifunctional peptidase and arginyl-hydroxylase JMJD5 isoform X4 [Equus quagga]|uniref:bifunctional peptidase and arginyl-hydroxylase JMJD5 isoform X4 n=1 Tax=Equus quagga TaxID=89248 RepID=UPI001EE24AA9|nr:bifunctional peptidase and arginyl-hydroxylase JMJD5 isoform X4 [Equus quagga]